MTSYLSTFILQESFFGGVKGGKTIDPAIKRFIIGVAVVSAFAVAVMAYFIMDSQGQLDFEGDPDLVVSVAVKPNLIEFWQEMPFRLHDRVKFIKSDKEWLGRRLYP